jgi:hypothetical protein
LKKGLKYRFVPWSKFSDPEDIFTFNEALDGVETYRDYVFCKACNQVRQSATAVEFELRNNTTQPLIHGTGQAFIHKSAREIIENRGFKGFCYIPNSYRRRAARVNQSSTDLEYFYLEKSGGIYLVPGILRSGDNVCPRCRTPISACQVCGDFPSKCDLCGQELLLEEEYFEDVLGNKLNGTSWPVQLSSWNLEDVVGGGYWFLVTGEFLEFLIANDIAPFAFGPVDVDCDGATEEQLVRAKQVRRQIPCEPP